MKPKLKLTLLALTLAIMLAGCQIPENKAVTAHAGGAAMHGAMMAAPGAPNPFWGRK